MNLRNKIILNKKLGPLLKIRNNKDCLRHQTLSTSMDKQIFSIEVDNVEDFITINDDDLVLKELDVNLQAYTERAYLLKDGPPLYILKKIFILNQNRARLVI